MSVDALFDQLDPVVTRWTMGGQAASLAPVLWKGALGDGGAVEQELRLLALSSQYLGLLVAPTPASALHRVSDIPRLSLRLLQAEHAQLARRCLKSLKEGGQKRDLIQLVASRGYYVHPADWMPSRHEDDVPEVYAPWRDWAEAQSVASGAARDVDDELTEANWDAWWPAARRVALAQIRALDPARAVALLAARAGGEGADARVRLIECLVKGLSVADVPYLESLVSDRAPRIKALAASLLARLGQGSTTTTDARELGDFFEFQTKGLLRRTRVLVPRAPKTPAQRNRRDALFAEVDYHGFAHALDTNVDALPGLWPFGSDIQADLGFAGMIERSAPADVVSLLHVRLMSEPTLDVPLILAIRSRLDTGQRDALARRVLNARGGTFHAALLIAGAGMDMEAVIDSQAGMTLISAAKADTEIAPELVALALIASQSAARAAFTRLTDSGLIASDPRLDLLRLNAALTDMGVCA